MSWISQTSEIKFITKSFWGSRIFGKFGIHHDRVINYPYSFRKQSATSFFKNRNGCFPDQETCVITPTTLVKKDLTHSSNFLSPILSWFLLPQRYLLFLLNQCYDYWLYSFGFLNIRERDVSSTNNLIAKSPIFKRKKNILNILYLSLSLFKMWLEYGKRYFISESKTDRSFWNCVSSIFLFRFTCFCKARLI